MNIQHLKKGVFEMGVWAMALYGLSSLGCVLIEPDPREWDAREAYERAVRDAEVAEPSEISRNLLAIVPENTRLQWRTNGMGRKEVLMVTWTDWEGYASHLGQSMPMTRDVWVTAYPELKTFCAALQPASALNTRLEQLLGLPPGSGKTLIVELWVSPEDLFRPSPDPEITDHEAELAVRQNTRFQTTHHDHIQWINELRSMSYGPNGYPWTRLGYTYDWGNAQTEVGLSEFVIAKGGTVEVRSVASNEDYCRPSQE